MTTAAVSLVATAVRAGVDICFANPGTTELPIVAAFDQVPGIRVVLGLFEGVCTGAADGWARMTGRPAATLLHLGPGLANGLANLHNARRARSPVVNWVGDHARHHLAFDGPPTSDIAALAGTVGWTRTVTSSQEAAEASLAAVQAALGPPGRVASLIIPADCQWGAGPAVPPVTPAPALHDVVSSAVEEAARLLRGGGCGLFLGGNALTERGLRAAGRVSAATGCEAWIETWPARQEGGRHLPSVSLLPHFPKPARRALGNVRTLVLAGAREPVSSPADPDQPSRLLPDDASVHTLADPDTGVDAAQALEAVAQALNAPAVRVAAPDTTAFVPTGQPLDPASLGRALAAFTPEGAIVVNEAATTGLAWTATYAATAAPHTVLGLTGDGMGQGLPTALGAALACPDRRVLAYQADGCGLHTLQALWSMARESADITVVVCANRRYRTLQSELAQLTSRPGPTALSLTDLTRPAINWADLARGFGVPACSVYTDTEILVAFARALAERGPSLIEAVLPG